MPGGKQRPVPRTSRSGDAGPSALELPAVYPPALASVPPRPLSARASGNAEADLAQSREADLAQSREADLARSREADLAQSREADLAQSREADLARSGSSSPISPLRARLRELAQLNERELDAEIAKSRGEVAALLQRGATPPAAAGAPSAAGDPSVPAPLARHDSR